MGGVLSKVLQMNKVLHNVFRDGAETCAEIVKIRTSYESPLAVYVDNKGDMHTPYRGVELPDHWLAGVFTNDAMCVDIAEAIGVRAMEIRRT